MDDALKRLKRLRERVIVYCVLLFGSWALFMPSSFRTLVIGGGVLAILMVWVAFALMRGIFRHRYARILALVWNWLMVAASIASPILVTRKLIQMFGDQFNAIPGIRSIWLLTVGFSIYLLVIAIIGIRTFENGCVRQFFATGPVPKPQQS